MLCIAPQSARRQLCHLIRLQREGEALLGQPELCYVDECRWEARVWKCLDKVAGRRAFDLASRVDREEAGPIDLLAFRCLNFHYEVYYYFIFFFMAEGYSCCICG